MLSKAALRKRLLQARDATDPKVRASRAKLAQENLLTSKIWRQSRDIALFMSIKSEIATDQLLKAALACGKNAWLPRVMNKDEMQFNPCDSISDLLPGPWGIPEPPAGPEPAKLDLILLPGLAFDLAGNRLGYGAGYYDHWLQNHPQMDPCRIGFCFSFQIIDQIPAESWDRPVSAIASEDGLKWL